MYKISDLDLDVKVTEVIKFWTLPLISSALIGSTEILNILLESSKTAQRHIATAWMNVRLASIVYQVMRINSKLQN